MGGVAVEVRGVTVPRGPGLAPILAGVSLDLSAGDRHALAGPSGCGKSTLLRVILGRVAPSEGTVRVGGREVPPRDGAGRRALARTVAWIPQDAAGSLDPTLTARAAVAEGLRVHGLASRQEAGERADAWLARVGLPAGAGDRRPGQLSGGQAQRVALARALAPGPGLVLADEPTSALDPLLAARVLHLLFDLCDGSGATVLLVAHSPGVVRRWCRQVTVLDAGRVVEEGPAASVLSAPSHPVTRSLVAAEVTL